ncbi:MAG: NADH-quinone oxidoreductase subunit N, partial [Pseudobdellovibrionaceae bacterium]
MKSNINLNDLILISPMIALFLTSLIPITLKVLRGNREQNALSTLIQGLIGLIISAVLLGIFSGPGGATAFNNSLLFDGITQWMGIIALISAAGSLILMYENPATKGNQFSEVVFLTLSSALGMLILVSAADLLMIFIGLEMMSLSLYLLI